MGLQKKNEITRKTYQTTLYQGFTVAYFLQRVFFLYTMVINNTNKTATVQKY